MGEPILSVEQVRKAYGDLVAVDGVSFTIAEGESYGLLGPNGAGKTTTISMICGLLRMDSGEVTVAGQAMNGNSVETKSAIGYVPQEIALYQDLTGRENLRFWGKLYRLRGKELATRVNDALATVGLTDRGDDKVEHYSGGMQRRLNIAAGLLHKPRLLVLDEPTVGVDPQSRNAILESVEALKAAGTAILYTTHYMEEAERLCDRVGIIDLGHLIAEGTRRELVTTIGEKDRIQLTASSGDTTALADIARSIPGVAQATVDEDGIELLCTEGRKLLPKILEAADKAGVAVASVEVFEPDLEAVFLHLTGKALRD